MTTGNPAGRPSFRDRYRHPHVLFDTSFLDGAVEAVDRAGPAGAARADAELTVRFAGLRARLRSGESLQALREPAFALVREVAHRAIGQRSFGAQVRAGLLLLEGHLIEMQTGEGKTLAAVMPASLLAATGRGVHVLTFNDYLARRDALWMGPIYERLGLRAAWIDAGSTPEERRAAYGADVTYLTAKEAGFDFLRDSLAMEEAERVHRPFHAALVDEADSLMIDEARIPLVLAGDETGTAHDALFWDGIAASLAPDEDYDTDEYRRNVFLTEAGARKAETLSGVPHLYEIRSLASLVSLQNALHARVLLRKDTDYIVRGDSIELVDALTGRIAERRRWPYGLQEAIEAKEGVKASRRGRILAQTTLQGFLGRYPHLCGMTGTAVPSSEELFEFYGRRVAVVPTVRPCIRKDLPDLVFTHADAREAAVVEAIASAHADGRPVLVGTSSVDASETLAVRLDGRGVPCRVLNAKNDAQEAGIIVEAGSPGAVTVSTNMAGRGTDIRLGGSDERRRDEVVRLGGLFVVGMQRHDSRRIDDQLRGRAGRQGDPGETRFFLSLEDDLFVRFRLADQLPPGSLPLRQDGPLDDPAVLRETARVQRIVEGQDFDARRMLSQYTTVVERQWRSLSEYRDKVLRRTADLPVFRNRLPERFAATVDRFGGRAAQEAERAATLRWIDRGWSDYLESVSYLRDSIHLMDLVGKDPLLEFNRTAAEGFSELQRDIRNAVEETLRVAAIGPDGIDLDSAGLSAPASTWTYLVRDEHDGPAGSAGLGNLAQAVSAPLWTVAAIVRYLRKGKG